MKRYHAEVVEVALAGTKILQLVGAHHEKQWAQGVVTRPQVLAHGERAFGSHVGAYERSGPAVFGFGSSDRSGRSIAFQVKAARWRARATSDGSGSGKHSSGSTSVCPYTLFSCPCAYSCAYAYSCACAYSSDSDFSCDRASQQRQVTVQLELAYVSLVCRPFGSLVADEPFEHVLAERLCDEL